jgi:hypothetical protein
MKRVERTNFSEANKTSVLDYLQLQSSKNWRKQKGHIPKVMLD